SVAAPARSQHKRQQRQAHHPFHHFHEKTPPSTLILILFLALFTRCLLNAASESGLPRKKT
ncbi:MAG: hypothetical protein KID09_30910, partial [Paenibacillus macerans]|uniref:hypothetical protein n=1 Tax=Paenibacillus macerans TaxID=44252 RepID=UPI00242FEE68